MKSLLLGLVVLMGGTGWAEPVVVRIGHFPNVTHAQGVIAHRNGWFEKRLGPDVKIQWFVYNAGPSAMEAIAAPATLIPAVSTKSPAARRPTDMKLS